MSHVGCPIFLPQGRKYHYDHFPLSNLAVWQLFCSAYYWKMLTADVEIHGKCRRLTISQMHVKALVQFCYNVKLSANKQIVNSTKLCSWINNRVLVNETFCTLLKWGRYVVDMECRTHIQQFCRVLAFHCLDYALALFPFCISVGANSSRTYVWWYVIVWHVIFCNLLTQCL